MFPKALEWQYTSVPGFKDWGFFGVLLVFWIYTFGYFNCDSELFHRLGVAQQNRAYVTRGRVRLCNDLK